MFLALRELVFARGRFALMGLVVALIAVLMVLLSGLSVGLVNDGVSGLQRLPVTSLAFQQGVAKDAAFSRSVVDVAAVGTWRDQPGVEEAEPFGNALVNARSDSGVEIDLTLFGVQVGGFVEPDVADGRRLAAEGEAVISATAHEEGVEVGDTLMLEPASTEFKVVGVIADQRTYGHVDVAYVALPTWQEARAGVRARRVVPDRHLRRDHRRRRPSRRRSPVTWRPPTTRRTRLRRSRTSLRLLTGVHGRDLDAPAHPGVPLRHLGARRRRVLHGSTVQRRQEIAVLRAIGATTGFLVRDRVLQSAIMLVAPP